jgi:hypothetical protein
MCALRGCRGEQVEILRVRLLPDAEGRAGEKRKIHIAVHRSYTYLADLLGKAFEGRQDVEIVVTREVGGSRSLAGAGRRSPAAEGRESTAAEPQTGARRRDTRRRSKDEQSETSDKPTSQPPPGI